MTIKEFSDGFDILLNSFGNVTNIALDEYEKSIFLTNAQEQLIIDLYSGNNNMKSFELTESIRRYLSNIVTTYNTTTKITGKTGLSTKSTFFEIPSDVWFITYESVTLNDSNLKCTSSKEAIVIPMLQDDLSRTMYNPFRGPSDDRVLRLDNKERIIELVSNYNIDKYTIRYLAQPNPIILINLPEGLSINGVNTKSDCILNPVIHRAILEKAVQLAIFSKTQLTSNRAE